MKLNQFIKPQPQVKINVVNIVYKKYFFKILYENIDEYGR